MKQPDVWIDGKLLKWEDATVHVLCHSLQRGCTIFESLDCSKSVSWQPAIFRLNCHMKRFLNSARIIGMKLEYSLDELNKAVIETVSASGMTDCTIRPLALHPEVKMDVYPGPYPKTMVVIGLEDSHEEPESISLKISSLQKMSLRSMPIKSKVSANYITPMMAKADAVNSGYDDAVLLDENGFIAECPTGNIFFIKNGILITSREEKILAGITRDSAMTIASDRGYEVREEKFFPDELKNADEVFYVSSGKGIMSVHSIDSTRIGGGEVGAVTSEIRDLYRDATRGKIEKYKHWLTLV